MKPWDPPEERLYGVVDDLLDDWQVSFRPPFEGIRIVGHRWSPQSSEVRDFLARNFIPYQWLNVETDEAARQLILTVLGHKLKGITINRVFDRTLPRITAHGGELNQVWTNLIDNAVGALNGSGTITISTRIDGDHVVVEIADDGTGIPPGDSVANL